MSAGDEPRRAPAPTRVRAARPDEAEQLRAIATAAKRHWGYDAERVRAWAAALDFRTQPLGRKEVYVADVRGCAVGWAAAIGRDGVFWLDDLWIEPAWMRRGIGAELFRHAAARGRQRGAARMEWEAERHAIGFYEAMGGRHLRDSEPGVWGRVNAVMGVDLS